jgi:hypothetical protein
MGDGSFSVFVRIELRQAGIGPFGCTKALIVCYNTHGIPAARDA